MDTSCHLDFIIFKHKNYKIKLILYVVVFFSYSSRWYIQIIHIIKKKLTNIINLKTSF